MDDFELKCHPYQKLVINHIIKNPFSGVFLDMGMGKTSAILYAFKWLVKKGKAKRMLIIAPKFVALNTWLEEIEKWNQFKSLKINIAVGNENTRLDAFQESSDIVIINRENTLWMVKNVSMKSFQVLCIDELSSFKNPESKRVKALFRIIHRFNYRWGLTGTPAPNGYIDLFSQLYVINPLILGYNYYSFRQTYFYEEKPYKWELKKNAEENIQEKIKPYCLSLKAEDYLSMPSKIENHIKLNLNESGSKAYIKALQDMVYINENRELKLDKNLTIKLQQLASGFIYLENGKYEIVHSIMLDALDEIIENSTGNVLLFYNFQAEKDLIKSKFGYAREIKKEIDFKDWNQGNIKLAVCHPVSVGYGMNLQSGGNNIIWYGYNWAADTVQQANARLYRQGQQNGVVINYLYVDGTIHNRIWDVLSGKIDKQDMLIESVKYVEGMLKLKNK
jgi:SNF2 family DNA or RNA helicase